MIDGIAWLRKRRTEHGRKRQIKRERAVVATTTHHAPSNLPTLARLVLLPLRLNSLPARRHHCSFLTGQIHDTPSKVFRISLIRCARNQDRLAGSTRIGVEPTACSACSRNLACTNSGKVR
jgi:hypothetical protein